MFDYPGNWTVTNEEVSQTDETVVLTNERGSTITYTYIGGVAEGQLVSGSATDMTRIELLLWQIPSLFPVMWMQEIMRI